MARRSVKVIRSGMGRKDGEGREYDRLRVMVNLTKAQIERLGWREGTEVEIVDQPDGILLRRAKK